MPNEGDDKCACCAERGVFGYRDKQTGEIAWYCAKHRLGQYWADARRGKPVNSSPAWEGWEDAAK
jgi:hypothetical protein